MKTDVFLLEDYKLKVEYLTNHFTRMVIRVNIFLTIDTALLAFSLKFVFLDRNYDCFSAVGLFMLGLLLSSIGILIARLENYFAKLYRRQVALAYHLLRKNLEDGSLEKSLTNKEDVLENYSYVGDLQEESFNPELEKVDKIEQNLLQGRRYKIAKFNVGLTDFVPIITMGLFVVWVTTLSVFFLVWYLTGARWC
jgi:hypothetical protein